MKQMIISFERDEDVNRILKDDIENVLFDCRGETRTIVQTIAEEFKPQITHTYCDSCLTEAYDIVGTSLYKQHEILNDAPWLLQDHLCDRIETDGELECECKNHKGGR